MEKYLSRKFGGYDDVIKLISVHCISLQCTEVPSFEAIRIEMKRKERVVTSDDFKLSEGVKLVNMDAQLNLVSEFYVDKHDKCLEKEMSIRLIGVSQE